MAIKGAAGLPREAGRLLGLVVHGVEVYYDPDTEQLAHAVGVWWRKRIVVGPIWWTLHRRERYAILLHEAGHCRRYHLEVRLLWLPLFWTEFAARLCRQQELAADAFVAEQGYGADLLAALRRLETVPGTFYPSHEERYAALERRIKEHPHAIAA